MTTPKRNRTDAAGFSLTELLTVLGIIAILSAIIFPVFFHVRENGRKTACASNLRQIGQAFSQYVSDYDSTYPPIFQGGDNVTTLTKSDVTWINLLPLHNNNECIQCPDITRSSKMDKEVASGKVAASALSGYAMNPLLNRMTHLYDRKPSGKTEARLSFPSLAISAFDVRAGIVASARPDTRLSYADAEASYQTLPVFYIHGYIREISRLKEGAKRHSGGANYAFADGHAKWLKPEQLSASSTNDGIHPSFGL